MPRKLYLETRLYNINDRLASLDLCEHIDQWIDEGLLADMEIQTTAARALLEMTAPMEVVNGVLIPALDKVGADFEAGRIFLPQLIQAAGAAQAAFEVVRERLSSDSGGETARQIVFSVRSSSATTRFVFSGSSPRAAHSTDA